MNHYDGAMPIFETYGVQKQIDDAFHRQVWLKCGGYIVIDETEALVAIVNETFAKKFNLGKDAVGKFTSLRADTFVDKLPAGAAVTDWIGDDGWLSEHGRAVKQRVESLTDDVETYFLPLLTNGKVTGDGLAPHSDLLAEFPYVGPPHNA